MCAAMQSALSETHGCRQCASVTGDTTTYRATGPYMDLSCRVTGHWVTGAALRLQLKCGDYIRLQCAGHQLRTGDDRQLRNCEA